MSNLTKEQIQNLKDDGYEVVERGGKTTVIKETPSGTVKYQMEDGKVYELDSYFGNVRDKDDHDRFSVNYNRNQVSGHGFNHKK